VASTDFYVWATNRARTQGATQYYRITVPLTWLDKLGYTKCYEDRGAGGEDDIAAQFTADIDLYYSVMGRPTLHQIRTIKEMKKGKIQDGSWHYPPTPIWDTDDNPDFTHPFNQAYGVLGVRHYPSGEFLEPGETLEWEAADGTRRTLWADGVTKSGDQVFDIARNIYELKVRQEIMREAVGVTVASPALASYMRDVIGQRNVYVFPNTVVPSDYEEFPLQPAEGVRVLWQGGQSHWLDWYPLRNEIAQVFRENPTAKLVLYGEKFDWITDVIPPQQLEVHAWSPYEAYKIKRGLLRIDINLCPLADNVFNRCKSAIKWYEGSIWSRPEATLAANVAPYREIVDGESGLLYSTKEEFVQKLNLLIRDADLRKKLGHGAREWVLANRTPEKTIPGLFEFYQDCRARTKGGSTILRPTTAQAARILR
jgi:hypothetical protein